MDPNAIPPAVPMPGPQVPVAPPTTDAAQMPQQPMMEGGQQITPEQKQELLDIISQIRQKLGSFNAMKFASGNKLESVRRDLLRQVFEKLQLAGVDLTDRQSVADFMADLQQRNPELAEMFEKAMEVLLEGDFNAEPQDPTASMDLGVPPPDVPQMNNMNNPNPNETIPQAV